MARRRQQTTDPFGSKQRPTGDGPTKRRGRHRARAGSSDILPADCGRTPLLSEPNGPSPGNTSTEDNDTSDEYDDSDDTDDEDEDDGDETGDSRILNGMDSAKGEWPFVVLVLNCFVYPYLCYACTGSLISERWLITAAHCFKDT